MSKNKGFSILLLVLFMLSLGGCFSSKPPIGVFDKEKALKESKEYASLTALKDDIAKLNASLSDKRMAVAEQLQTMEQEANDRMQGAWSAQMRERQNQLNDQIMSKNKGFIDSKNEEMGKYVDSVEADFMAKAKVLEDEARQPATASERVIAINKEITALENEAKGKLAVKKAEIQKEIDAKMSEDGQAAGQELDTFGERLREDLMKAEQEKGRQYVENLLGDDQKNLNVKQKELDDLLKKLEDKITAAVEKIAKDKKLTTVLSVYTVNVQGTDITADVVKEINNSTAAPAAKPAVVPAAAPAPAK